MDTEEVIQQTGPGAFQFSAIRVENLGATEYTLVTMVIDVSGSVIGFAHQLLQTLISVITACRKNARAENLLLRYITFNHNIIEEHGFRLLNDIDIAKDYIELKPDGMTALFDATYDAVGATVEYSSRLVNDYEFDVNGIVIIVTDGMNNRGSMTPKSIKDKVDAALLHEEIESLITILVQLKDANSPYSAEVTQHLKTFYEDANLTQHVDIGDATPEKLAKLAQFVSQSISSQSQSLGTGSASQSLTF